jgi:hypothetical protein
MTRNTKKTPHAENEILAERFPDKFRFELTELKRAGNQQKKYDVSLLVKWLGNDPLSTSQFKKRIQDETGMSRATFFRLLAEAEKQKRIVYDGIANTWERPKTL